MLAGGCDDMAGGAWLEPVGTGTGTTGPPGVVPDIIPAPGVVPDIIPAPGGAPIEP